MGLLNFLKNEFIDIIDWVDESNDVILWKFPRHDNEIKMNAKLTVRESQQAVFLNEGTIADVYAPGMYTLSTQNMPILASLKGWKYGFDSPFKADVYFINTRQFIDQKWGTKNAITIEDPRFGFIELRAFGTFAYKVIDGGKFLKEVAGTGTYFSTEEINGQLRSLLISKFTTSIGKGLFTIEKIAGNIEELSNEVHQKLNEDFNSYGLEITTFLIENVSMPDAIKEEIFEYSRLNKIDMQKLTQFKTAQSIETAAQNNNMPGLGVGMGIGMGMGNMITNTMYHPNQNAVTPPPIPVQLSYFVAINGQQAGPFDLEALKNLVQNNQLTRETLVWTNSMANWEKAEKVTALSVLFTNIPPQLPTL
ncbi:SPFH domain / Band 7 family protein [Flavobacterium columnare]|uniref:SPFH domain-containing protein n=2 Tax=Flavobacterium TaxID=237 RepID=A0ABW8PNW1_9FLAO|nr:SPFH domain-containing protein [Flavobacterium columnare]SPE76333.1 SPFH domain / Band 7 family protein [Flavobacterium columnare]